MNTLQDLNKYTYRIDGDLTEFTPWHTSALKAAIAIELNYPCSEECLFDALEVSTKLFGATENQVQFGSTVINKSNDDLVMLMGQYMIRVGYRKLEGRWYCGHAEANAATHSNECKHISISECIAALPAHLLEI